MEFLVNSKIDFMKLRFAGLVISLALIGSAVFSFFQYGLNFGIDFAGGTEVQLKFKDTPQIEVLRDRLKAVNLGESTIQRFGKPEDNEILIRAPELRDKQEGQEVDASKLVISALAERSGRPEEDDRVNLNIIGRVELANILRHADENAETRDQMPEGPVPDVDLEEIAERVISYRKTHGGLISDIEELQNAIDLEEETISLLKGATFTGDFSIRQIERVGPKVGAQLKSQARGAIFFSLIGILLYIWFRFQLQFSIGAIAALVHDVVITLGILSILQIKFNLTIIAALLTIVGYSLNDTIVIFDRVRENLRSYRGRSLFSTINKSINESLSRTVLTSLTTLLVVACLYFFGGEVINGFAFTLMIGIVVGTYSSIFMASPILLVWRKLAGLRE